MASSVELREQRAALVADSKRWLTQAEAEGTLTEDEITAQWSKRNQDIDKLLADANKAERHEKLEVVESELERPQQRKTGYGSEAKAARSLGKVERNSALRQWMSYNSGAKVRMDSKAIADAESLGLNLSSPNAEARALGTVTVSGGSTQAALTSGANALYGSISPNVLIDVSYQSDLLNRVRREQTADGNDFVIPKISDLSRTVSIVGEGADAPEGPDPVFERVTFKAWYFRQIVPVTYEMLQDAGFDLEGYLGQFLSLGYARTIENYLLTGTGSGQPQGILPATTQTVTLPATKKTVESFDQLMSLVAAVNPAYRRDSTFVLSDALSFDIRRIKATGTGQYVWDVNTATNGPVDRLLGYPYIVSSYMDDPGTFSKTIAWFGNLKHEVFREVQSLQIQRLNELYAKRGMVGFYLLARSDARWLGFPNSSAKLVTPAS